MSWMHSCWPTGPTIKPLSQIQENTDWFPSKTLIGFEIYGFMSHNTSTSWAFCGWLVGCCKLWGRQSSAREGGEGRLAVGKTVGSMTKPCFSWQDMAGGWNHAAHRFTMGFTVVSWRFLDRAPAAAVEMGPWISRLKLENLMTSIAVWVLCGSMWLHVAPCGSQFWRQKTYHIKQYKTKYSSTSTTTHLLIVRSAAQILLPWDLERCFHCGFPSWVSWSCCTTKR